MCYVCAWFYFFLLAINAIVSGVVIVILFDFAVRRSAKNCNSYASVPGRSPAAAQLTALRLAQSPGFLILFFIIFFLYFR